MKKLFFFRSSTSINGNKNSVPPEPTDEKVYWETLENGINNEVNDKGVSRTKSPKVKPQKQFSGSPNSETSPGLSSLRRSRSYSSATSYSGSSGERNLTCISPNRSPLTSSNIMPLPSDYSDRSFNPEKQSKATRGGGAATQKTHGQENVDSPCLSRDYHENSSYVSKAIPLRCGSNHLTEPSTKVLDLYIDGELHNERILKPRNSSFQRNPPGTGSGCGWRPPRVQSTAPASPTCRSKERSRSYSFGEMRDIHDVFPTRNWTNGKFGSESPQELAKNVVERLSLVFPQKQEVNARDFIPGIPTTVEDVLEDYLDPHPTSSSDGVVQKSYPSAGCYKIINGEEMPGFEKQCYLLGDVSDGPYSVQMEDEDVELHRKAKEIEERFLLSSGELEQEHLLQDSGPSASVLFRTIRNLSTDCRNLAVELSTQLRCRITDRASAKEALRVAKVDLDSQTRRLEREKNELQAGLEKELDRRSNDWSCRLEKYQLEEQRLRERVRELAEQNVSLQREVSSLSGKETENRNRIVYSEQQLKDLMERVEQVNEENQALRKTLSDLQDKLRVVDADKKCIQRNYKEKENENKELQKAITRLQRTCAEQEKTIVGLRQGLEEEIKRKQFSEAFDNHVLKLQMEQVRLTGVEQFLRKEVESYRFEVESLQHENINLLDRLRSSGNVGTSSSFKLDQELFARIDCLQSKALLLLNESNQLCVKFLDFVKGKRGQILEGIEKGQADKSGLDDYFVVESDMKVQSLKRGTENLRRSLQTIAEVLHEKSKLTASESQSQCIDDGGLGELSGQDLEDDIEFMLKEQNLITRVLREKLCSKEMEIEQLQAEVATAVRNHDILGCQVQNALDALSSMAYKMKDLELQILEKDENINQLKCDLHECTKEVKITRGILPKISEERDSMLEEVKQFREMNMLLDAEVNLLKKKIEALEEDILLKEGQITILKDSLANRPYDILYDPKSMQEFTLD
ncbi:PREDICTED: centriolin isoform X2 [Nelumbo nucifera]|uniref:Centriolin isoform X2 n=1 Tax=Nelumbo nucifera TaxID=4432 RepID=A0A1U7Z1J5_NELNU|nr:PREDICTED: centriolin isoform X2 [Nelumbo nucifera]